MVVAVVVLLVVVEVLLVLVVVVVVVVVVVLGVTGSLSRTLMVDLTSKLGELVLRTELEISLPSVSIARLVAVNLSVLDGILVVSRS